MHVFDIPEKYGLVNIYKFMKNYDSPEAGISINLFDSRNLLEITEDNEFLNQLVVKYRKLELREVMFMDYNI